MSDVSAVNTSTLVNFQNAPLILKGKGGWGIYPLLEANPHSLCWVHGMVMNSIVYYVYHRQAKKYYQSPN